MDKYLELRKRCLTLISRIAARAASSPYPGHARISLWELNYVLRDSRLGNALTPIGSSPSYCNLTARLGSTRIAR
jgi:hypothetical protein